MSIGTAGQMAELAREEERESIVAWLRDPALYRLACKSGPLVSESALRWLADHIEKGAHEESLRTENAAP